MALCSAYRVDIWPATALVLGGVMVYSPSSRSNTLLLPTFHILPPIFGRYKPLPRRGQPLLNRGTDQEFSNPRTFYCDLLLTRLFLKITEWVTERDLLAVYGLRSRASQSSWVAKLDIMENERYAKKASALGAEQAYMFDSF